MAGAQWLSVIDECRFDRAMIQLGYRQGGYMSGGCATELKSGHFQIQLRTPGVKCGQHPALLVDLADLSSQISDQFFDALCGADEPRTSPQ
jgi:hypothetical protein